VSRLGGPVGLAKGRMWKRKLDTGGAGRQSRAFSYIDGLIDGPVASILVQAGYQSVLEFGSLREDDPLNRCPDIDLAKRCVAVGRQFPMDPILAGQSNIPTLAPVKYWSRVVRHRSKRFRIARCELHDKLMNCRNNPKTNPDGPRPTADPRTDHPCRAQPGASHANW